MFTLTQFDSVCFDPASDVYDYSANLLENIATPPAIALMNPCEKAMDNPLKGLVEIARSENVKCISVMISPPNESTQQMCQQLGFALDHSQEMGMIEAWIEF